MNGWNITRQELRAKQTIVEPSDDASPADGGRDRR
jgi:hypothetical protein